MLHLDLDLMEESLDPFLLKAVPVKEQGLMTLTVKVFSAASCWLVHLETRTWTDLQSAHAQNVPDLHTEMLKKKEGGGDSWGEFFLFCPPRAVGLTR